MNINKVYLKYFLISLIIAGIIVLGLNQMLTTKVVATTFSLQFKGVEKGIKPDGTRFDYEEIINEEVLKAVSEQSGIPYNRSLKEGISIEPVLPNQIVDKIKQKREKGEMYTYYPNEFKVIMDYNKIDTLDLEQAKKFMANYKIGYETYFLDQNQYPFMDLNSILDYFDYASYDYPELTNVFNNEFNMIFSYLNVLIQDNPTFVSKEGYTFKDLKETIETSKNIELNQINSLVNAYRLTNDVEELILKYQYMIKRTQLDIQAKTQVNLASEELLTVLEANEKSILIPGSSGENMTISMQDKTYDNVASQATEAKLNAVEKNEDIKYLLTKIQELQDRVPESQEVIDAKNEVDSLVENLNTKIATWVQSIEKMAGEYYEEKYSDAIMLVEPAIVVGGFSIKMIGFLVIVFTSVIFTVLSFFGEKKYRVV